MITPIKDTPNKKARIDGSQGESELAVLSVYLWNFSNFSFMLERLSVEGRDSKL